MSDMFRCLSCHEMIFVNAGSCRFCGAVIDVAAAKVAAQQQATITHACSVANNVKHSWVAAPFFLALQLFFVFVHVFSPRLWLLAQVAPPAMAGATFAWLRLYGSLRTSDPDLPAARESMKRTLYVWLVACVIQLLLLGVFLARIFLPDSAT